MVEELETGDAEEVLIGTATPSFASTAWTCSRQDVRKPTSLWR